MRTPHRQRTKIRAPHENLRTGWISFDHKIKFVRIEWREARSTHQRARNKPKEANELSALLLRSFSFSAKWNEILCFSILCVQYSAFGCPGVLEEIQLCCLSVRVSLFFVPFLLTSFILHNYIRVQKWWHFYSMSHACLVSTCARLEHSYIARIPFFHITVVFRFFTHISFFSFSCSTDWQPVMTLTSECMRHCWWRGRAFEVEPFGSSLYRLEMIFWPISGDMSCFRHFALALVSFFRRIPFFHLVVWWNI